MGAAPRWSAGAGPSEGPRDRLAANVRRTGSARGLSGVGHREALQRSGEKGARRLTLELEMQSVCGVPFCHSGVAGR